MKNTAGLGARSTQKLYCSILLLYCFMSKYFPDVETYKYDKPFMPTLVEIVESDEKTGQSYIKTVCLETYLRPCSLLSFSDFSISTLLKNGVSPKSLAIVNDARIGFDDSVFDELDSRISEISESLFVSPSN